MLRLLAASPGRAREYCSVSIQLYDELLGTSLRARNPLPFIVEQGWAARPVQERIELPIELQSGGGMRLDELATIAMVTRLLRPSKVFEIGTFRGRTTSVLRLNAPADACVVTLDLPPEVGVTVPAAADIDTDSALIEQRDVGSVLRRLAIEHACEQIFCDSLAFDPEPHRNSVELGLIDGAHSRRFVENDTLKMAVMMAPRGLVLWHDYGGKGRFRELTEFLDELSKRITVYRVPRTTLAWTSAEELRKLSNPLPVAASSRPAAPALRRGPRSAA